MATTSPRLIEYGKSMETKNGLKTLNLEGCLVKPNPVNGSIEKPVIIQDVIVSGTFFDTVVCPSGLLENFVYLFISKLNSSLPKIKTNHAIEYFMLVPITTKILERLG
jgi:hypothetical protein